PSEPAFHPRRDARGRGGRGGFPADEHAEALAQGSRDLVIVGLLAQRRLQLARMLDALAQRVVDAHLPLDLELGGEVELAVHEGVDLPGFDGLLHDALLPVAERGTVRRTGRAPGVSATRMSERARDRR